MVGDFTFKGTDYRVEMGELGGYVYFRGPDTQWRAVEALPADFPHAKIGRPLWGWDPALRDWIVLTPDLATKGDQMGIDWQHVFSTRPLTFGEIIAMTRISEGIREMPIAAETLETIVQLMVSRADGRLTVGQVGALTPDDLGEGINVLRESIQTADSLAKLAAQFNQPKGDHDGNNG